MRIAVSRDRKAISKSQLFGTPEEYKEGIEVFEKFLADLGNPKITGNELHRMWTDVVTANEFESDDQREAFFGRLMSGP